MTRFSILVTNSRNGGQHELTIEATNELHASEILKATRPHYIIKRIDAI
jgi:hypothetical protein